MSFRAAVYHLSWLLKPRDYSKQTFTHEYDGDLSHDWIEL